MRTYTLSRNLKQDNTYLDALEKLIGLLYVTNTFTLMIKRYIEFSVNWISSIQPLHYPDWVMNVHI